jgi:hypothetical protein
MNNALSKINAIIAIAAVAIMVSAAVPAQDLGVERDPRPFDFSNDYYRENGIVPELMAERRSGADGWSVIEASPDADHRDVRITATMPAYSPDGEPIYWNPYGRMDKGAFVRRAVGVEAQAVADSYPMFVFPSTSSRGERQAPLVVIDDGYFVKNVLGIASVWYVRFTDRIVTPEGRAAMRILAGRNGFSLDGTPIVRHKSELDQLLTQGLIEISRTTAGERSGQYMIGRVLRNVDRGAIAADAFLISVLGRDGQPLAAEHHFFDRFECLRNGGTVCL